MRAIPARRVRSALVLTALVMVGLGAAACGKSANGELMSASFDGKKPPELKLAGTKWLNAPGGSTLHSYLGKVVFLKFGFLRCPACRAIEPQLDRWTRDLGAKGFTVVAVEYGPSSSLDSIEEHVRSSHVEYPVLFDADGASSEAYGVKAFPSAFVLNKNGRVVWEGVPLGAGMAAADRAIQKALDS